MRVFYLTEKGSEYLGKMFGDISYFSKETERKQRLLTFLEVRGDTFEGLLERLDRQRKGDGWSSKGSREEHYNTFLGLVRDGYVETGEERVMRWLE